MRLNEYVRTVYGHKLYKIALDGGFTCPNRDGTIGTGGCIFCSGSGSGDFCSDRCNSITEQIEEGKRLVEKKNPGGKYIAYFQAYTGTYAPVERLRALFTEAIAHPDIEVLSIGTRPDCLPPDVLELLKELNQCKPIWIELGLQTIHAGTAAYIRRGYDLSVYDQAVRDLQKIGISQIITHVILGLPGETQEMMLQTVQHVAESGSNGIKLQLLHVLKGTDLAEDYAAGKFETLSMEAYISILCDCVRILPETMVIHRLTGDGSRRDLIAPLWSLDKKRVLNTVNRALQEVERPVQENT